MAGKAKRGAERRAEPASVVDLNLWDVLLGLVEPKDGPEVPDQDQEPGAAVPGHTSEVEEKGAAARPRPRGGKRVRDPAAKGEACS